MWLETTVGEVRAELNRADITGETEESLGRYALVNPSQLVARSTALYRGGLLGHDVLKYRYELFDAVDALPDHAELLIGLQRGGTTPVVDIVAAHNDAGSVNVLGSCIPGVASDFMDAFAAAVGLSEWEALRHFALEGTPEATMLTFQGCSRGSDTSCAELQSITDR